MNIEDKINDAALKYAQNHSSAPDKETPDWIITDFKSGATWQSDQIKKSLIKITQMSDCGTPESTIVKMKEVATEILNSLA